MKKKDILRVLLGGMALLALAGCTNHVSRGLSAQGEVTEAVFPEERHMVMANGIVPKPDHVRLLTAGLNKDQLRALVGIPHFREGHGAREWDYLFHLEAGDGQMTKCRFKVVFDSQSIARTLLWLPDGCAALAAEKPAGAPASAAPRRISLSADMLFPFGRSGIPDMGASGRQRLEQIAAELRGLEQVQVQVLGYADRIGDDAANQRLSQRRADAVRQVLVGAGVPTHAITARGMGERPATGCSERLPRARLVDCLAPDRRVEIVVDAAG